MTARTDSQVSAGGVVVRREDGSQRVALVSVGPRRRWQLQASAIDARGNLLLFLANSAGSWGEIGIRKDGLACVLDGGEEWQAAGQGGQL